MKYEVQLNEVNKILKKFFKPEDIKTILEIGARDGVETLALNHFYPQAHIYSFECNPATAPLWRKNTENIANITLVQKAVSDKDGTISFFPIDPEKTVSDWIDGNPGASSLLKASGKYEVEKYAQKEIEVETTTLSTFLKQNNINHINFIWMDIQGAELMALRGLEECIYDIDIINTEVEFIEMYKDQPQFKDIKKFMNEKNFILGYFSTFGHYAGDAVFINKKLLEKRPCLKIYLEIKNILAYPVNSFIMKLRKTVGNIFRFLKLKP